MKTGLEADPKGPPFPARPLNTLCGAPTRCLLASIWTVLCEVTSTLAPVKDTAACCLQSPSLYGYGWLWELRVETWAETTPGLQVVQ